MTKEEILAIREALAAATPEWCYNGNEIISRFNTRCGIGGFLKDEDNVLAVNAPTWLQQLLDENERLEADMEAAKVSIAAWKNLEADFETLKGNYRQLSGISEQLQADKAVAVVALRKAERFIGAMRGFYGEGLQVVNWHQNGDAEPLDNFFENNMDGDELQMIRTALERMESDEKNDKSTD